VGKLFEDGLDGGKGLGERSGTDRVVRTAVEHTTNVVGAPARPGLEVKMALTRINPAFATE
jgi:hypothetical protein